MPTKPKIKLKAPPAAELAGQQHGRDITKPYIDKIMQTEDRILVERGRSNLDIYEELLRDDQVYSTLQQRRTAVTKAEWDVAPASDSARDKEIAEFVKANLQALRFDNLTEKMHMALFFGYAVAEKLWGMRDGRVVLEQLRVRRQRRFRFGPAGELLLITLRSSTGELMPPEKFWTLSTGAYHDDEPYGLGLAHYLYWPIYFKRNGLKFWLKLLERFGSPVVVGKAPTMQDESQNARILEALRSIRQDSAVLLPEGVEVDLLQATANGSTSHEQFERQMDAAVAKIVLSQVMTTEAVGGQYKADVQKDVRDEVIKADADLICESFNDQVIPQLVDYNFPGVTAYPKVWRDTEPDEDLKERAERDTKIHALGFDPTEDYIAEHYGEGWVKREPAPAPFGPGAAAGGSLPPEFAEASRLHRAITANRADAAHVAHEARRFATQYDQVIGERVEDIIQAARETGNYEDFTERLAELLADGPPPAATDKLTRAGFFARLLGMFREQSNAGQ
jgi:phage gp29-like protein